MRRSDEVSRAVTALTLAELAAGPHAATDPAERARRQDRSQRNEAAFAPLPFDTDAARAYLRRRDCCRPESAGARAVDLMIAAVASSVELPLYTRTPSDFSALDGLVDVIAI